jgi:hypothetical protein
VAAFWAAAKTLRGDVVPATCSAPSTPRAIQPALILEVEEVKPLGGSATLAFTSGGIEQDGVRTGAHIGDSVQTFVIVRAEGRVLVQAFQNTRSRPITDRASAQVWQMFDRAWNERG